MQPIKIESERNIWAYDVEVYPNFFSLSAVDINSETVKQYVVHESRDDREALKEFLDSEDLVLVGYNSLGYDNLIINKLNDLSSKFSPTLVTKLLYQLSQKIINTQNSFLDNEIRNLRWQKTTYRSIDMMQIKPSSMRSISLKQIAINLKWHKIQDLPKHWSENVSVSEVNEILEYNLNDVGITKALFYELKEEILLREGISELFKVNVINETRSGIANKILNSLYARESGLEYRDFKDLRTQHNIINIGECISRKVSFETHTMQKFHREIAEIDVLSFDRYKFKRTLSFAGNDFEVGIGGLHSKDKPGIFESTSEYTIRDADGTSFYPNWMRNEGIYPEHLDKDIFLRILNWVIDERVNAKDLGDMVKADALKITINSIFGKLGSEFYWLLDAKSMIQVTINGQMSLLKLIEMFYLEGIEVISANTDGVVCRVHESQEHQYNAICEQWQKIFDIRLEYTEYRKYIRRDVNNYFTIKGKWNTDLSSIGKKSIKEKGIFERNIDLFKGYSAKVVPKAIFEYFVYGTPIEETITKCDSIYEFMYSQKTGGEFKCYLRRFDNVTQLQKNNRFYVSKNGGNLYKKKPNEDRVTSIIAGSLVTIANDVDSDRSIESYNIDYSYYVREALKIIELIEPVHCQMSIFDVA